MPTENFKSRFTKGRKKFSIHASTKKEVSTIEEVSTIKDLRATLQELEDTCSRATKTISDSFDSAYRMDYEADCKKLEIKCIDAIMNSVSGVNERSSDQEIINLGEELSISLTVLEDVLSKTQEGAEYKIPQGVAVSLKKYKELCEEKKIGCHEAVAEKVRLYDLATHMIEFTDAIDKYDSDKNLVALNITIKELLPKLEKTVKRGSGGKLQIPKVLMELVSRYDETTKDISNSDQTFKQIFSADYKTFSPQEASPKKLTKIINSHKKKIETIQEEISALTQELGSGTLSKERKKEIKNRISSIQREVADTLESNQKSVRTEVSSTSEQAEKIPDELSLWGKVKKNTNNILFGAALVGVVAFETFYVLTRGKSFFVSELTDHTTDKGKKQITPGSFEDFFANHKMGKAIENTIEFIASKPFKRIIRMAIVTTAFLAADVATTGGALTLGALVVTGTGILVNSINEYRKKVKIESKLVEADELRNIKTRGLKIEKTLGRDSHTEQLLKDFLTPESHTILRRNKYKTEELNPSFTSAKTIFASAFESIGAFVTGSPEAAISLFIGGTLKEVANNTALERLNLQTSKNINEDVELIRSRLGNFGYKNLQELREFSKKQEFLQKLTESPEEILRLLRKNKKAELPLTEDKKCDFPRLSKEKLNDFYNDYREATTKKATFYEKLIEKPFIKHFVGYLLTAIPSKKFEFDAVAKENEYNGNRAAHENLVRDRKIETIYQPATPEVKVGLFEKRTKEARHSYELRKTRGIRNAAISTSTSIDGTHTHRPLHSKVDKTGIGKLGSH